MAYKSYIQDFINKLEIPINHSVTFFTFFLDSHRCKQLKI